MRAITGSSYADLITKLRAAFKGKRDGKLRLGALLHLDMATRHRSWAAIQKDVFVLEKHPPYSPRLSDYATFRKLKKHFRGRTYWSDSHVIGATDARFAEVWRTFFQETIEVFEDRRDNYVEPQGDYVLELRRFIASFNFGDG